MENKTDKPYSLQDAERDVWVEKGIYDIRVAAELYASKATEELRKENELLQAKFKMKQETVDAALLTIERLKESNKELVEALKHSLSMMEQTLSYRESNGLTAGNIFLSSTIKKAKEIIQKSEGDVNKKI